MSNKEIFNRSHIEGFLRTKNRIHQSGFIFLLWLNTQEADFSQITFMGVCTEGLVRSASLNTAVARKYPEVRVIYEGLTFRGLIPAIGLMPAARALLRGDIAKRAQ